MLKPVYSIGKWVVQWDYVIDVPAKRMVYVVLGASHGRVYVISLYHTPSELAFEGFYQLPLNWHGDHAKDFKSARGEPLIADRELVMRDLEQRALQAQHIVGDLDDGTDERNFENWYHPAPGYYWRWRTKADGQWGRLRDNHLAAALRCAFQHPRTTRKKRVPCNHCDYPFKGA